MAFLDEAGYRTVFEGRLLAKAAAVARGFARRIRDALRLGRYDLLLVYRETTPFGPAFVERWSDRLDGLGASRERTPAGTVAVLGTESPFVYDIHAKRVDSYTWKAPFYAALGTDTFMHETQAQRGVGELVPDFEAHRRAAGFEASPVGKGQNFELRLVAAKPTSVDAAAKWLARRKEITVPARLRKGASILYQNPDTAVQAGFVVEEVGEFAVLRFDLPLRKPSFFAVEAMPLCVELAEGHGMLVSMDGQTHGQAPNVTTLAAAWEKANVEAISSSGEAIPRMTRERSDRWWHYMRRKADLHKRLGDDVFVPKERVFLSGEIDFAGLLALTFVRYHRFTAVSYKLPLLELMAGAGYAIAEANGVLRAAHVRDKLTHLAAYHATVRGLIEHVLEIFG